MMDKNLEVYSSKQVITWYTQLREIIPVEKIIFEKHKALLQQGSLLDIGIGGGRTTAHLLNLCKKYTGIDYSENFVNAVKKQHPEFSCFVMDARDLSTFKNESFDFVNFSFNGMDYVNLEGREKIIFEISRVLKPNGLFFFSTHNKNHPDFNTSPWLNRNNSLLTNIKTFIKLIPFFTRKMRHKKNELFSKDFAIINDSAHNYGLMTFYTSPAFLRTQLADAAFGEINFYTKLGEKKEDSELENWIFVTGKKINL